MTLGSWSIISITKPPTCLLTGISRLSSSRMIFSLMSSSLIRREIKSGLMKQLILARDLECALMMLVSEQETSGPGEMFWAVVRSLMIRPHANKEFVALNRIPNLCKSLTPYKGGARRASKQASDRDHPVQC